jgi:hypothetical protein
LIEKFLEFCAWDVSSEPFTHGAPANTQWLLPYSEQLQNWAKVNWLSNEGVRISSIIADAQSRLPRIRCGKIVAGINENRL